MARSVSNPGAWPVEMRAETAAAFCDEPSVDAFMKKVERGVYCQPKREPGCLPKWHRAKLEEAIANRHGLRMNDGEVVEDAVGLI